MNIVVISLVSDNISSCCMTMARTAYPVVPPSQLVGRTVLGQVSYTEGDIFW